MLKRDRLFILLLLLLAIQPFTMMRSHSTISSPPSVNALKIDPIQVPPVFTLDGAGGEENIKTNVRENGGFESLNSFGIPFNYNGYMSSYQERNATYQDIVHGGSYAYLVSSKGTAQTGSSAYGYRSLNSVPYPYLDQDINLDCWVYGKSNPDIASGGQLYLRVRVYTGSANFYLIYMLSANAMPSNSTYYSYFDVRVSLGSWQNIQRNITYDYEQSFGAVSPTTRVYFVYAHSLTPANPTGFAEIVTDDYSLTNGTAYEFMSPNGDFESGDGSNWYTYKSGPGFVYATDDHTEGNRAMNLTAYSYYQNSYSYAQLDSNLGFSGNPRIGYYATSPGNLVFEFDWKYSDTVGGGGNQMANLYIEANNGTHFVFFYFFFGTYDDTIPDYNYTDFSTMQRSYAAQGFGNRDNWQHLVFDPYEAMAEYGFNNMAFNYMYFNIQSGGTKDCTVTLLIDDFRMTTYPVGDPGFEEDWYYSPSNPIVSWEGDSNQYATNLTSDAHSGKHAANLTSHSGGLSNIQRQMWLPAADNLYTDFWWKTDSIGAGSGYSYIYLYLEGGYILYYILCSGSSFTPTNSSLYAYYFVDQFNTTGVWNNLVRNVANDATEAFGYHKWNITVIHLKSYSSGVGDVTTTLFDDLHFVYDTTGPEIASVVLKNTPTYYEDAIVDVTVSDVLSSVDEVILYYRNDSTWYPIVASELGGGVFRGIIPFGNYGTVYEYYVEAEDAHFHETTDNNGGLYYSYTIGDDVNPIVSITTPANESIVSDSILITADCSDVGSDIDYVEFYDGVNLLGTDSSAPYSIIWDTRTTINGLHEIFAVAFDNEGNSESTSIILDLDNDFDPPTLENLWLNPSVPVRNQPVDVHIQASDVSGLEYVKLFYRIDSGSWFEVNMTLDGGNYTGEIPGIALQSKVEYYVVAADTYNQITELGSAIEPYSYEFPYTAKIFFTRFGVPIGLGVIGVAVGVIFMVRFFKGRKVA